MGQPFRNFPPQDQPPSQPPQPSQGYPPYSQDPYAPNPSSGYEQEPPRGMLILPGWVPPWVPRDIQTLGLIGAGAFGLTVCVCVGCLVLFVLLRPIPAPGGGGVAASTPSPTFQFPTVDPTLIATLTAPPVPTTEPFDPSVVGQLLNPYAAAGLEGMLQLSVAYLDPGAGGYVTSGTAQAGSAQMEEFITALNIANFIIAPDPNCPNHVRLSITRADNSLVTIFLCLKGVVHVRGVPGLRGADLPMGGYFGDILKKYLPAPYQQLLR